MRQTPGRACWPPPDEAPTGRTNRGQPPLSATAELAQALIRRPSLTPDDAGCQALVAARLGALGFRCEFLRFGSVENLYARLGTDGPLYLLAGHTDVVPVGDRAAWSCDPFGAEIRDKLLYGRGAADMKGAIAAMVVAVERLLAAGPLRGASLGFLLTSDEEGPAVDGTAKVLDLLAARGEHIAGALVGEPSSQQRLGDVIRVGRRGSLSVRFTVRGVQGHVAYPERAKNPIHAFAPVLAALTAESWDHGGDGFPPSSFQVSNAHGGTGAGNVIPGTFTVDANFRYGPGLNPASIRSRVHALLATCTCPVDADWNPGAAPFRSAPGPLLAAVQGALTATLGQSAIPDTGGGTSDGRFFAAHGSEVVELGLPSATIHAVDECVAVADLDVLTASYQAVLATLLQG